MYKFWSYLLYLCNGLILFHRSVMFQPWFLSLKSFFFSFTLIFGSNLKFSYCYVIIFLKNNNFCEIIFVEQKKKNLFEKHQKTPILKQKIYNQNSVLFFIFFINKTYIKKYKEIANWIVKKIKASFFANLHTKSFSFYFT